MATAAPAGWPCPACTLDNAAAVAVCEACGGARPQEGDILTNPSGMFGGMALAGGSHGGGIPAAAEAALGYTSPPALSEAKGPSSGGEAMSNMFAGLTTNPPPPTAAAASGGFGGGAGGKKEKPSCCSLVGGLASTMAGRKKGAKPRPPSPVGGGDETGLSPAEEALCATASLAPLRDPLSATAPSRHCPLSATAEPTPTPRPKLFSLKAERHHPQPHPRPRAHLRHQLPSLPQLRVARACREAARRDGSRGGGGARTARHRAGAQRARGRAAQRRRRGRERQPRPGRASAGRPHPPSPATLPPSPARHLSHAQCPAPTSPIALSPPPSHHLERAPSCLERSASSAWGWGLG